MRIPAFFLCVILLSAITFAQDNAKFLEVDYEMEMKLDIEEIIKNIPSNFRAQVEAPLREEIKNGIFIDYKLKTNGKQSSYELQPKINNNQGAAGMILQQIISSDKGMFYKNIEEREFLKEYNIMGTEYLVKDSLLNYKWTLTREKDNVAGFEVKKATGVYNDSINITAWYAPKLKFKDGPDRAWGLPGLILKSEFNMDNGTAVILTAKSVGVETKELEIKKPNKGKELTEKEFQEEMLAFQKKMREMQGGGVNTEE